MKFITIEYTFENVKGHNRFEYNEGELEMIKQHIWEKNERNDLIDTEELCCINIPNKISVHEYLSTVSIYLSYIKSVRVLKSPTPNVYFIYMHFKNKEYANIFYNTFNLSKINPIEKDFFIFSEIKSIFFNEHLINGNITNYSDLSFASQRFDSFNSDNSPHIISEYKKDMTSPRFLKDSGSIGKQVLEIIGFRKKIEDVNTSLTSNETHNELACDSHILGEETRVCPICLESIESKKNEQSHHPHIINGIIDVLCGHSFHIECFLKFNDDKCPLCRYYLSPVNMTSCSLCTIEDDLWICLICGALHCGELANSNDHRKEHYINTGHIYAKGTGGCHNITYDFSKNCNLNQWFQNSILTTNNLNNLDGNERETNEGKQPKEKVEFIIGEYNSILSSQLESQRSYYLDCKNRLESNYVQEKSHLEKEITAQLKVIEKVEEDLQNIQKSKCPLLELAKKKEILVKESESILSNTEYEYKSLIERKALFENQEMNNKKDIADRIRALDSEINDLVIEIKDLKMHINARNKIEQSREVGLSEGSFTIINMEDKTKKSGKRK